MKTKKTFKTTAKMLMFFIASLAYSQSTNAQSQVGNPTNAFWNGGDLPMANVGTVANPVYAIYSGDVNQDGTIDGLDLGLVEVRTNEFVSGYYVEDCNGDGTADGLDLGLVEINTNKFLSVARPY